MGKYDQFLVGLSSAPVSGSAPSSVRSGKYDQFVSGLDKTPRQIVPSGGRISLTDAMSEISNLSPAAKIQQKLKDLAGAGAERMGAAGVNPKLSAALMTPVAIAPDILGAATVVGSIRTSATPLAKAIRSSPKMLGAEFQAGEKAAGISGELPVQRGAFAKMNPRLHGTPPFEAPYKPKSYPKDTASFLNFAKARVQALGDKLSPQELDDYKTLLSTNIDAMKAKGLAKTEPFAIASQLRKEVTQLHNAVIPGRGELNKVYAISKKIHPDMGGWVKDGVKKYGVKAIGTVLAGLGIGAGTQLFK